MEENLRFKQLLLNYISNLKTNKKEHPRLVIKSIRVAVISVY